MPPVEDASSSGWACTAMRVRLGLIGRKCYGTFVPMQTGSGDRPCGHNRLSPGRPRRVARPSGLGSNLMGVRTEPTGKRVRGVRDGEVVVDSVRTMLVWEDRPYPAYWFPEDDVVAGAVEPDRRGEPGTELAGLVRFPWATMDHWFEEDEEVIV